MLSALRKAAFPLQRWRGTESQYQPLLDAIGDSNIVLFGTQTFGSKELYVQRAALSELLISKKVTAGMTDVTSVHRYIQGMEATSPLHGFHRYPRFVWRNEEVEQFVEFLRNHNSHVKDPTVPRQLRHKVSFHGLDIFCMDEAMRNVTRYLRRFQPHFARTARRRYGGLMNMSPPTLLAQQRLEESHEIPRKIVQEISKEIRHINEVHHKRSIKSGVKHMPLDKEGLFNAEQSAKLVLDAEKFYFTLLHDRFPLLQAWNIREQHMADHLLAVMDFENSQYPEVPCKMIVWTHNVHAGDSRATSHWGSRSGPGMAVENVDQDNPSLHTLGQLLKEGEKKVYSIGMSTFKGRVVAAKAWPMSWSDQVLEEACDHSHEHLLHQVVVPPTFSYYLVFSSNDPEKVEPVEDAVDIMNEKRLLRNIGVVYQGKTDVMHDLEHVTRNDHYMECQLADQFDAVVHVDQTGPTTPLDIHDIQEDDVQHNFDL